MNLLNRPFLSAALFVLSALLTYFGVIPQPLSDAYIGEIVTAILAAVSGGASWRAYVASKIAAFDPTDQAGA